METSRLDPASDDDGMKKEMGKPRPRWVHGWTYLIALAMGWGSVKAWRGHAPEAVGRRTSSNAGRTVAAPSTAVENLALLVAAEEAGAKKTVGHTAGGFYEEVGRLRKTLAVAADPKAEALGALETGKDMGSLEFGDPTPPDEAAWQRWAVSATRILQWFENDEAAAREYARRWDLPPGYAPLAAETAVRIWIGEMPRDRALTVIRSFSHGFKFVLDKELKAWIGSHADFEGALWIGRKVSADELGQQYQDSWADSVAEKWPSGDLDGLFRQAVGAGNRPLVRASLSRMLPQDLCGHLEILLAGEGRSLLKGNQPAAVEADIYRNETMSREERIALIKRVDEAVGGGSDSAGAGALAVEWKSIGDDGTLDEIARAYRSGDIDAAEARRRLISAMPGAASLASAEVDRKVMQVLAGADPARALDLLEGLPVEDRYAAALNMAQDAMSASPADFLTFQEAVPFGVAREQAGERLREWKNFSRIHDSDRYRRWLSALPPGRNRDLALEADADEIAAKEPYAAGVLRSRITNREDAK